MCKIHMPCCLSCIALPVASSNTVFSLYIGLQALYELRKKQISLFNVKKFSQQCTTVFQAFTLNLPCPFCIHSLTRNLTLCPVKQCNLFLSLIATVFVLM